MSKPIFKILSQLMQNRGLKVSEVARLCDLPDSTVRGIISRQQNSVALEVAFKLSRGLNVPLEFLNGEVEDQGTRSIELNDREFAHIKKYQALNESGKSQIDSYTDFIFNKSDSRIDAGSEFGKVAPIPKQRLSEVYRVARSEDDHAPTVEKRDMSKFRNAPKVTKDEDL